MSEGEAMTADSDEYPTALANTLADAMKLWDECDGIDADDPSLRECIENDWSLAAFLALYVRRLPVEQRMEAMGMERPAQLVHLPWAREASHEHEWDYESGLGHYFVCRTCGARMSPSDSAPKNDEPERP